MNEKKPWFIGPMLLTAGGEGEGSDGDYGWGSDDDEGGRTGQHGE